MYNACFCMVLIHRNYSDFIFLLLLLLFFFLRVKNDRNIFMWHLRQNKLLSSKIVYVCMMSNKNMKNIVNKTQMV